MSDVTAIAINKSKWGPGPWQDEPDRLEWKTEAGFPALIIRQRRYGNLCGYVAVPPGHPWHGKDPHEAEVHGGITHTGECSGGICHTLAPGEPDNVWWLGFDCAHAWDFQPGAHAADAELFKDRPDLIRPEGPRRGESYRGIAYVKRNCESLARQAVALRFTVGEQHEYLAIYGDRGGGE